MTTKKNDQVDSGKAAQTAGPVENSETKKVELPVSDACGCSSVRSVAELPTGRRCFMAQAGAAVLAAAAVAPAVLAAATTVLTPVKKHFSASDEPMKGTIKEYPVGTFAELPEDGTPMLVSIRDELVDGWSKEVNVVGAIFARRMDEKTVKVLHTMCPHMGSTVGFKKDQAQFFCPSHSAYFDLDGHRLEVGGQKNPCKRDMDELNSRLADDGMIYVEYCCFKSDSAEKIQV